MPSLPSLIAAILATGMLAQAQLKTNIVSLYSTPPTVQKVINSRAESGKVNSIEKSFDGGEIIFDVDWTDKKGEGAGFTVAEDGTLLNVEVELSDTPMAVQKTIQTQVSESELKTVQRDVSDPDTSYNVQIKKNGRESWFTVGEDGTILSKEVALEETPGPVQETVRKKIAGRRVKSIDENFDDDITFDVTTTSGGNDEKSFTINLTGVLLTEQVALEEVHEGALKTIRERIGNGTILRVDKALVEKQNGVLPYQVHGRKDGKPFDFSVGPRGRFLGMDE